MGIPTYFSHVIRKYPSVISKLKTLGLPNKSPTVLLNPNGKCNGLGNQNVHRLYLDSNSIIYDSIQDIPFDNDKDAFESTLIHKVCSKLEEYIKMVSPKELVYIAFDGIAPQAKLKQQKTRRYKSWYMKQYDHRISNGSEIKYIPNKTSWDTSAITPGTEFMNKLNLQIRYYFRNAKQFTTNSIIISGSDEAGEGEHKIMLHIRESGVKNIMNDNIFVYGLDADLIMLTLNHIKYCPNLYLFRETPEFIKSINNSLDPYENYVIDISYLRKSIESCIYGKEIDVMQDTETCIEDYMFICFLLGNDFLPHFPSLNIRTVGMDYIIETYRNIILNRNIRIINKGTNGGGGGGINWKHFRLLIRELAKNERANFMTEHKHRDRMEKRIRDNRDARNIGCNDKFDIYMLDSPILERPVEKYINPFDHGWETRYYDMLCNIDLNEIKKIDNNRNNSINTKRVHRNEYREIKEMCTNYLEGLEWTYNYYTGVRTDWSWCYNYNYPPLLHDLQYIIPYCDEKEIIESVNIVSEPSNTDVEQLSYTLPYASLYLLPIPLQRTLNSSPECGKLMNMEWAYCRYFWECHVLFK